MEVDKVQANSEGPLTLQGLDPWLAALLRRKLPSVKQDDVSGFFKNEEMIYVLKMNGIQVGYARGHRTLARKLHRAVLARGVNSAAVDKERVQLQLPAARCVACRMRECTFKFALCDHPCMCSVCMDAWLTAHNSWQNAIKKIKATCPECHTVHSKHQIVPIAQ